MRKKDFVSWVAPRMSGTCTYIEVRGEIFVTISPLNLHKISEPDNKNLLRDLSSLLHFRTYESQI